MDKATGKVTDIVEYMTADVEDNYIIAQANEPLDAEGRFVKSRIIARDKSEILEVDASQIDYVDVAPKMLVSVATAMIPFLENDDNTRALMGSNMQKQAVPLMVLRLADRRHRYGVQGSNRLRRLRSWPRKAGAVERVTCR